jgi:aspartyl-tRNA(Asn)/glutamyl-tRNA(Gln) amidotransferase subunit A
MTGLLELSARDLLSAYASGEATPVEAVEEVAERTAAVDTQLGAFTTLCFERARSEARACEEGYRRGDPQGPLAGLPLGVKDLFDSEGVRTTYGSPMCADHVPKADAEALRRARAAGAILVGKTQTHEWAWGISSVNELMGTSRNPWALDRISGGSSGGSAVALASHQVTLALGSDTGGSIRVPSALCGTVGFKPTYGRVSTAGIWPLARTLDHPGPMARSPADAALLLGVIAGWDPADPATADVPLGDLAGALARGLEGRVVGICPDMHLMPLTPAAQFAFDAAIAATSACGARIEEVRIPEVSDVYAVFGVTQRAEALHTHTEAGLYPARAAEYGGDVRGRLETAAGEGIRDYLRAAGERARMRAAFARAFMEVELILTPVNPGTAVPIGSDMAEHLGASVPFRDLVMSYTTPQDLIGLPACAFRAGFDDLGIPVGVQFTGAPWADAMVLGAAHVVYEATPAVQSAWPEIR